MLCAILGAQDGEAGPGYRPALREIHGGRKASHWIWYVWPGLATLRPGTSRPSYLHPDFDAARQYLAHPPLGARLAEITAAAVEQLEGGVKPLTLFGSATDCEKFAECMATFAFASAAEILAGQGTGQPAPPRARGAGAEGVAGAGEDVATDSGGGAPSASEDTVEGLLALCCRALTALKRPDFDDRIVQGLLDSGAEARLCAPKTTAALLEAIAGPPS